VNKKTSLLAACVAAELLTAVGSFAAGNPEQGANKNRMCIWRTQIGAQGFDLGYRWRYLWHDDGSLVVERLKMYLHHSNVCHPPAGRVVVQVKFMCPEIAKRSFAYSDYSEALRRGLRTTIKHFIYYFVA